MMGGVSPETCWAITKHWNNKFYYTAASCWFFLWDLYYGARISEHQEENVWVAHNEVASHEPNMYNGDRQMPHHFPINHLIVKQIPIFLLFCSV
jgi:hypothetical protein